MVFTNDRNEQSANKQVGAVYTLAAASGIFASLQQLIKREDARVPSWPQATVTRRYAYAKIFACARFANRFAFIYLLMYSFIELPKEKKESVPYFLKI